jgi:hypothetical protein
MFMNRLLTPLAALGAAAALGLLSAPARAESCAGANGCGNGCANGGCGPGGGCGGCGWGGWGKCCWPQHAVWDCDFAATCCGCCNLYYCAGACVTPYPQVFWPPSPVLAAAEVRARLDRLGIPLVPPPTVYLGKVPGKAAGERLPPPREGEPKKGRDTKREDTEPESNG